MTRREELAPYLEAAREIVAEAAATIRERVGGGFEHRLKDDGSFVTEIDLEIEELIRRRLRRLFPGHAVLGEEGGERAGEAGAEGAGELAWVVDPVDGTASLRHGVPLYGTLLALTRRGEPVVGAIALPALGRIYSGARGLGCERDGVPLRLAAAGDVERQIVAVGERRQFVAAGRAELFDALMRLHPGVRVYSDCFGHALALEGAVGAMVDFDLKEWDWAATSVLIEEAGGRAERLDPGSGRAGRYDVVFGRPEVVEWLLERLASAGALEPPPSRSISHSSSRSSSNR